jgi:peptidoglycan hydrolase-like protein with peptidoglycan-binding domain
MTFGRILMLAVLGCSIGFVSISSRGAPPPAPIVKDLQARLLNAGFSPGPVDGFWGRNTESALRAFQDASALPPSGRLDVETAARLDIDISAEQGVETDINDMLASGRLEVKALGGRMDRVIIEMRSRLPYVVGVRIPIGTYFVASASDIQNMVSTGEVKQTLNSADWETVTVPAASTSLAKSSGADGSRLKLQALPASSDLPKLLPALTSSGSPFPARQAAIWLLTDNPTFEDLRVLLQSRDGISATRSINETQAAEAMRVCSEAGIDIESRKIWADRATIQRKLSEGALKEWLEQGTE